VKYNVLPARAAPRRPKLWRVRRWLIPWVETMADRHVVALVEGWGWHGPEYDQARYVIYLRIGEPSSAG
jgi:hypothetical protein